MVCWNAEEESFEQEELCKAPACFMPFFFFFVLGRCTDKRRRYGLLKSNQRKKKRANPRRITIPVVLKEIGAIVGTNEAALRVPELPPIETSTITVSLENFDTVEMKRARPKYISFHCFISAMYCLMFFFRFLSLLCSLVLFPSTFVSLFFLYKSFKSKFETPDCY